jgi:DNA transformation protein
MRRYNRIDGPTRAATVIGPFHMRCGFPRGHPWLVDMARTRSRASRFRSLKVSEAFKSFVLDQLQELDDVTPRSMFGGVGLYHNGVFFGILARDRLYLKVGDANRADYERAGMPAFKPYSDRRGSMRYFEVPVDVLESAPELAVWARKAITVARRG